MQQDTKKTFLFLRIKDGRRVCLYPFLVLAFVLAFVVAVEWG